MTARKKAPAPAPARPVKLLKAWNKFTPEIAREICKGVEEIGYLAIAAEHVGLHRNTAYNWQRAGLAGDPEFAQFAQELIVARAKWFRKTLSQVRNPEWLLERADPSLFGPKAEPPVAVNVVHAPITREGALARLRELAEDDPGVRAVLTAGDQEPR